MTVNAKTVTNVVASAEYWELSTDAGCGVEGCLPSHAVVRESVFFFLCFRKLCRWFSLVDVVLVLDRKRTHEENLVLRNDRSHRSAVCMYASYHLWVHSRLNKKGPYRRTSPFRFGSPFHLTTRLRGEDSTELFLSGTAI